MTAATVQQPPVNAAQRIEELGRIIMAYSEVTEKLQESHERLQQTVAALREELGEKNRLLERRNRLAALGEMAAGMAHEIRNPLGGIQLYASMLAKDVEDRRDSLELVKKISGGVKRLESLVSQVLQFTREIRVNVGPADLTGIVSQSVEMAAHALETNGAKVEVQGPEYLEIQADALLLGQAILNLVLNGAEAGGDRVTVEFGAPVEGIEAKQFWLTVKDNGSGIPPEVLDRIFNPFFTTKDTGTGLGLAMVHRVIEAHDGTIVARNAPGGGAMFEVRV